MPLDHLTNKQEDLKRLSEQPFHECKLWNREMHDKELHRWQDRKTFLGDMQLHADSPYAQFGGPMHERTQLEKTIHAKMPVAVANAMEKDMRSFEARARKQHLEPEAVQQFYHQINRLLTEKPIRELTPGAKHQLAREIMHQAAHPESVVQGQHNTCNVASVEFRLYMRAPEAAARTVTNLALSGHFMTKDLSTITLNKTSLEMDSEAKNNPHDGTKRTYASQLLQLGAVNVRWQRDHSIDGLSYFYQQDKQHQERLMQYIDGKPPHDSDGTVAFTPKLGVKDLTDIYNQIARTNDKHIAAENINGMRQTNVRLPESTDNDVRLRSTTELHTLLLQAKREHKLPLFLGVHTGNHPFDTQQLRVNPNLVRVDGDFGWHGIAIYDYDEKSHTAKIHNSWGKANDINVNVDQLYKATVVPNEPGFLRRYD